MVTSLYQQALGRTRMQVASSVLSIIPFSCKISDNLRTRRQDVARISSAHLTELGVWVEDRVLKSGCQEKNQAEFPILVRSLDRLVLYTSHSH